MKFFEFFLKAQLFNVENSLEYDTNFFIECGLVSLERGFLGVRRDENKSGLLLLLLLLLGSGVEKCHQAVVTLKDEA